MQKDLVMKNTFKELEVWQRSIKLTTKVYQLSSSFPNEEKFGIISQIRRASVSIAANIAEGQGRNNPKEFRQFLGIAKGSLSELETLIIITLELGFASKDLSQELTEEINVIHRMLIKLIAAVG